MSKFTVSESNITVNTPELTEVCSIKDLGDDIMTYTNEGNECIIDSPVDYVGIFDCCFELLSIVAEEKAKLEAAAIENSENVII